MALSATSKDAVIAICDKAIANGAKRYAEAGNHGWMFQWGFEDLDGHLGARLDRSPALPK